VREVSLECNVVESDRIQTRFEVTHCFNLQVRLKIKILCFRFEVLAAVVMEVAIFRDIAPFNPCSFVQFV
jgi:hypothetical protein